MFNLIFGVSILVIFVFFDFDLVCVLERLVSRGEMRVSVKPVRRGLTSVCDVRTLHVEKFADLIIGTSGNIVQQHHQRITRIENVLESPLRG